MEKTEIWGIVLVAVSLLAAVGFKYYVDLRYTAPLIDSHRNFGELYGPITYFRPYVYSLFGVLTGVGYFLFFFRS